jgi:arabinan endo-1,5-alpha-L-arabinosidase
VIPDVFHFSSTYNPQNTPYTTSHLCFPALTSLHYFLAIMKGFSIIRNSGPARLITSLLTALLITSATFIPFLVQGAVANPVPVALPQPNPHADPEPQPDPQGTGASPLEGFYPEPERCLGNCSGIHDPSIWYENGTYWRFSTSGNIAIATAPSLGGPWRYQGALLHEGTSIHVTEKQDIWVSLISFSPTRTRSLMR